MTYLIIAIGLVVLVVVIGYLMPVRYEGRTIVELDHAPPRVWEALQDSEAHPLTGKMMKSVETLPPDGDRPRWKEDMGHGEIITVTTDVFEPAHRLVRELSSGSVNMKSRWEYELEPAGEGCRVTLSGVTDIERGTWHTPIFRVMMFVGGGVKKGLDIHLGMLGKTLGASEARPS